MNTGMIGPTAAQHSEICCADDACKVSTEVPYKGEPFSAPIHGLPEHGKVDLSKVIGVDLIPPALTGDCLVSGSRGIVRVQTLGNPYGASSQSLLIDLGSTPRMSSEKHYHVEGLQPTIKIETARGYGLRGTPQQSIQVVDQDGNWKFRQLQDVTVGDCVPLRLDGLVGSPQPVSLPPLAEAYWTSDHTAFVPRHMTADLAEFIGYFMGDGSLHSRTIRLCVAQDDQDVVERLLMLGRSLFGVEACLAQRQGYIEVAFNSVRLVLWWEACGFAKFAPHQNHSGKGYAPHIPDAILYSNDADVYAAFVRGLFEADGTVTNQYVSFSTSTRSFCNDVQAVLLALGFVTTHKLEQPDHRWGYSCGHVLRLLNVSSTTFFLDRIGFLSMRKQTPVEPHNHPQAARCDQIPVSRTIVDRLAPANDNLRRALLLSLSRHRTVSRHCAQALYERSLDQELQQLLSFYYDKVSKVEISDPQPTYALTGLQEMHYLANGFTCLSP